MTIRCVCLKKRHCHVFHLAIILIINNKISYIAALWCMPLCKVGKAEDKNNT